MQSALCSRTRLLSPIVLAPQPSSTALRRPPLLGIAGPAARRLVPGAETPGGGIGRPGTRDASRAAAEPGGGGAVLMAAAHSRPP